MPGPAPVRPMTNGNQQPPVPPRQGNMMNNQQSQVPPQPGPTPYRSNVNVKDINIPDFLRNKR